MARISSKIEEGSRKRYEFWISAEDWNWLVNQAGKGDVASVLTDLIHDARTGKNTISQAAMDERAGLMAVKMAREMVKEWTKGGATGETKAG
jgi:hypothetical protein